MRGSIRRLAIVLCGALLGGLVVVPLLSSGAGAGVASHTFTIGVDHSTPTGHNFEYVDYFPRSGVAVRSGDTLDFQWANTPDGLHTATLLATATTPNAKWGANPLAVPDPDDGGTQLQINPAIGAPTFPPAGTPAPGACGNAAAPCTFDGTADLNSGATPTNSGAHFVVKITAAPGTYSYVCLIHPGMLGSFTVVGPQVQGSTPAGVATAATAQGRSDTEGALDAEEAVPPAPRKLNNDGTHTVTVTAGTATPYVEIAEMLPRRTTIRPGDTITWITGSIKDPHTVTFPQGSDPATEPIPSYCEGAPDVLLTAPPVGPPCGNPALFENHFNPAPVGGTVISSPSTSASSGVFANPPAPFPRGYSFSFPNAGTFTYQCRIHDHMLGTVVVRPSGGGNDH